MTLLPTARFHVLPVAMHHLAAPVLLPVFTAPGRLLAPPPSPETAAELAALLGRLAATLAAMQSVFKAVRAKVSVEVFFGVYRPLLGGWDALPGGAVVLEGVLPPCALAPLGASPGC